MTTYIIDTETTSTEDNREVIALAYLPIEPVYDMGTPSDVIPENPGAGRLGKLVEEFFEPVGPMAYGSIATHHILPSELAGKRPSIDAKLPEDASYVVGHNVDFDWEALGRPDVKRICTYALAQHVWPDADSYSQSALLYMLLGPTATTRKMLKNAHAAGADVIANLELLRGILTLRPNITTWSALWEYSEECRLPLRMPITKARGELITDIEPGLLSWCLRQDWLPQEHPYLFEALRRERDRRQPPGMF